MPMRKLRSCDFCGGDAAGVYEVLPPELSPTNAEQRRIVLCSDCAGTLETVVDPLLARLGVETDDDASTADVGSPASEDAADAEPPRAGSPATTPADDASPAGGPVGPDRSDPGTSADPGERADSPAGGSTAGDAAADGAVQWDDVEPAGSTPGTADVDGDGYAEAGTIDPADDDHDDAGTIDPADDGNDDAGATSPTDEDDHGNADTADTDGSRDTPGGRADDPSGSGDGGPTPADEPEEFRTVMRLLGNREFPVERDAIVELATNAYKLDERHVHRIVDHAVDRGVIADDGGTLRRD